MPEGDYETVAGLVLQRLARIPDAGDSVFIDGWVLVVEEVDSHRIAELTVRKLDTAADDEQGTES